MEVQQLFLESPPIKKSKIFFNEGNTTESNSNPGETLDLFTPVMTPGNGNYDSINSLRASTPVAHSEPFVFQNNSELAYTNMASHPPVSNDTFHASSVTSTAHSLTMDSTSNTHSGVYSNYAHPAQYLNSSRTVQPYMHSNTNGKLPSFNQALTSNSQYSVQYNLTESQTMPPKPVPASQNVTNDPSLQLKRVQNQLVYLVHAKACRDNDCSMILCLKMKNVVKHIDACNAKDCNFQHCSSSQRILHHYNTCTRTDCNICQPIRQAKPNSTTSNTTQSINGSLVNGVVKPTSTPKNGCPFDLGAYINEVGVLPATKDLPWHIQSGATVRAMLVCRLVQTVVNSSNENESLLKQYVSYARKVEVDIFDSASCREEYYQLLAEKIYNLQLEIKDKKKRPIIPLKPKVKDDAVSHCSNASTIVKTMSSTTSTEVQPQFKLQNIAITRVPQYTAQSNVDVSSSSSVQFVDSMQCPKNSPVSTRTPQLPITETVPVKSEIASIQTATNTFLTNEDVSKASPMEKEIKSVDKPSPIDASNCKNSPEAPSKVTSKSPSTTAKSPTADTNMPRNMKVHDPEELKQALWPTLQKLYEQDPDSLLFREPVDPVQLAIPDYYDIIKTPMDLSTIKKNLESGVYKNPLEYIDHVMLMFENAWKYNRKTTKVYKSATKLCDVFEGVIDPVMKTLGYCCGRKYAFQPQPIYCYAKTICPIARDSKYYQYVNHHQKAGLMCEKYFYCQKCFQEFPGDCVHVSDDPGVTPTVEIQKNEFECLVNDKVDREPQVMCTECGRLWHQICAMHFDCIWKSFICEGCLKSKGKKSREHKYQASRLPSNNLSAFLENRINKFLRNNDAAHVNVAIKVLASSDKTVEVKSGMRNRYPEFPPRFQYKSKAIFAFCELKEGYDVCFFGMHVQEYNSDVPHPNKRRVYISYLDSVYFFQPSHLRTKLYHEILIGYLEYCKNLGYISAHIWACPPGEGDDYVFHCHPHDQKIPKPKRLQEWYRKMLDKAVAEGVVIDYKDIVKAGGADTGSFCPTELPYFEGDFWPNSIEESIKELEQEVEELHSIESQTEESEVNIQNNSSDKKVLGKKSKKSKTKNSSSKSRLKKSSSTVSDLNQKIYQTMDKHRENFFTIRLCDDSAKPITDPDPNVTMELMDGRDSFLQMARERFWEFSSLRRAMYSSLCLLYELHQQAGERCSNCKAQCDGTRYKCSQCDEISLCEACNRTTNHEHKLELETGSAQSEGNFLTSSSEQKVAKIRIVLKSLVHAARCRDANCKTSYCAFLKKAQAHVENCKGKCQTCKKFMTLFLSHARQCQAPTNQCPVVYCGVFRARQRHTSDMQVRRRMAAMQHSSLQGTPSPYQASRPSSVPVQEESSDAPSDPKRSHAMNPLQSRVLANQQMHGPSIMQYPSMQHVVNQPSATQQAMMYQGQQTMSSGYLNNMRNWGQHPMYQTPPNIQMPIQGHLNTNGMMTQQHAGHRLVHQMQHSSGGSQEEFMNYLKSNPAVMNAMLQQQSPRQPKLAWSQQQQVPQYQMSNAYQQHGMQGAIGQQYTQQNAMYHPENANPIVHRQAGTVSPGNAQGGCMINQFPVQQQSMMPSAPMQSHNRLQPSAQTGIIQTPSQQNPTNLYQQQCSMVPPGNIIAGGQVGTMMPLGATRSQPHLNTVRRPVQSSAQSSSSQLMSVDELSMTPQDQLQIYADTL